MCYRALDKAKLEERTRPYLNGIIPIDDMVGDETKKNTLRRMLFESAMVKFLDNIFVSTGFKKLTNSPSSSFFGSPMHHMLLTDDSSDHALKCYSEVLLLPPVPRPGLLANPVVGPGYIHIDLFESPLPSFTIFGENDVQFKYHANAGAIAQMNALNAIGGVASVSDPGTVYYLNHAHIYDHKMCAPLNTYKTMSNLLFGDRMTSMHQLNKDSLLEYLDNKFQSEIFKTIRSNPSIIKNAFRLTDSLDSVYDFTIGNLLINNHYTVNLNRLSMHDSGICIGHFDQSILSRTQDPSTVLQTAHVMSKVLYTQQGFNYAVIRIVIGSDFWFNFLRRKIASEVTYSGRKYIEGIQFASDDVINAYSRLASNTDNRQVVPRTRTSRPIADL